jgi:hypothetical protein
MPLEGLQRALGSMVAANYCVSDGPQLDDLDLTPEERAWLEQIDGSKGLRVTSYVQRSWRELGVYQSAILTASALGRVEAQHMIDAYLDAVHCQSLFVFAEAIAFLDFVIDRESPLPHVSAIARFERALLAAAQSASLESSAESREANRSPGNRLRRNPAAALVEFGAPPEALLGALTAGEALPSEGDELFPIIIAPRLEYLWRPATQEEARLFALCRPTGAVQNLLEGTGSESALVELVRIGALSVEQ